MPSHVPNSGLRDNPTRGSVADFLKARIQTVSLLSVVSAYFTIYAYDALTKLAHILAFNPRDTAPQARDPLMLAYFEQILNGLVYELDFPDEVHGAGLQLFDLAGAANLPALDALLEAPRLPRLRQLFETLHDGIHPFKIARQKLQTLDPVRLIEGKA